MKYSKELKVATLDNGIPLLDEEDSLVISEIDVITFCDRFTVETRPPNQEERKEIAEYMIELWKEWSK